MKPAVAIPAHMQNDADPLAGRQLIVVSNREPFQLRRTEKAITLEKTTGGLVSALDPVLKQCNGLWICWDCPEESGDDALSFEDKCRLAELNHIQLPYRINTVRLSKAEVETYYYGFANRHLWPLFHYFPSRSGYSDVEWQAYNDVNQRFARAVVENADARDMIWVQDYHLMLVPAAVRRMRRNANLGFFCHIPFPHYEMFRIMPARRQILEGLLGSDLVGFHTPGYANHFMECALRLMPNEVGRIDDNTLSYQNRAVRVEAFPISIDFAALDALARTPETDEAVAQLKARFEPAELIGLGVDRLDYTKGILERLECMALFFERYPEYRKRLVFVQIAVPSRIKVQQYQDMKQEIDEAVGRINGRYSQDGWVPIHYHYRGFAMPELISYYKAADFALVNPLRDGMNLVCKEYCAAQAQNQGALILSEMTGAADQLTDSYLVNPYDHSAVVEAVRWALTASPAEKRRRMKRLRHGIARDNINQWLSQFLRSFADAAQRRSRR